MIVRLDHRTTYRYDHPVGLTPHQLYLYPREQPWLRVLDFQIQTRPAVDLRWICDCFENAVAIADFSGSAPADQLEIHVTGRLELAEANPFHFLLEPRAAHYPFNYPQAEKAPLSPYLKLSADHGAHQVLDWFYRTLPHAPDDTVALLTQINEAIRQSFTYQVRDEEGIQDPDTTLSLGSGSCRDFTQFFIALCRQLGLAARFVSGYLYEPPGPAGQPAFGNRAHGSMHAWTEVYLPGAGWKGFDPTNGILADEHFIPCAVAHQPSMVNPIQGSFQTHAPTASNMTVDLQLTPETG
ncbi:MAG: transglutaminase family protein [Opitutales bacterium]